MLVHAHNWYREMVTGGLEDLYIYAFSDLWQQYKCGVIQIKQGVYL